MNQQPQAPNHRRRHRCLAHLINSNERSRPQEATKMPLKRLLQVRFHRLALEACVFVDVLVDCFVCKARRFGCMRRRTRPWRGWPRKIIPPCKRCSMRRWRLIAAWSFSNAPTKPMRNCGVIRQPGPNINKNCRRGMAPRQTDYDSESATR